MATPRTRLRLVLLQIRSGDDAIRQEQSCFIERCRIARRQFSFVNLVHNPEVRWRHVEDAHAVLVGGSGEFSVTKGHTGRSSAAVGATSSWPPSAAAR